MAELIELFRGIEAADEYARFLRREYGPLAEEQCKRELSALRGHDPYRSHLRDVQKALRWIAEN